MNIIEALDKEQLRSDIPEFRAGDTVKVYVKVVEGTRTFPVHSPRLEKIVVARKGVVRRAKLYYLRNLTGKAARIRERR